MTATKFVAVHKHNGRYDKPTISGGVVIDVHLPKSAEEWCDYYGAEIRDGNAIVFKAVDEHWNSQGRTPAGELINYAPGATPSAPDWDGGKKECGGGLHFSPHPVLALDFYREAKHLVACPVPLDEIAVHPNGQYPHKIKAPRVVEGCFEVGRDGQPLDAA